MIRATVDLSRINVNYTCLSNGKDAYAVVKSDAYGHGLLAVSRSLLRAGCRRFAVASAAEAHALLARLPECEVLLLSPPPASEMRALYEAGAVFSCGSRAFAERLASLAAGGPPARVHLALNSGMNRLGFSLSPPDFAATLSLLLRILLSPRLSVEGVYTHFAAGRDDPHTARQVKRFFLAASHLFSRRPELLFHAAATANLSLPLPLPQGAHAGVRIGLGLYGYGDARVRPAMSLTAPVIATGLLHRGEAVGYSQTYRARETHETACIACGYADGLPRLSGGSVLRSRNGVKLPILGRVSMNLCTVDARRTRLSVGEPVTLLDFSGKCMRSITEISGCSPYELLLMGRHADRRYIGQKE